MKFRQTEIADVWVVELEPLVDERGFFARSWCEKEFSARGIDATWVQTNVAFNERRGTLRGMHYQAAPHEEAKLVRAARGVAYCVALDVRSASPTFGKWTAEELTADNRRQLFVPKGVALGYQALVDLTEIVYLMSEFYVPEAARGIRFDDSSLAIRWPLVPSVVSERDRLWPLLTESCAQS